MDKERLKKLAELEERARCLADVGCLGEDELVEFEKVLAELEMLVR
ncbi:hypothetical protein ES703_64871 [subsurface metagenome]